MLFDHWAEIRELTLAGNAGGAAETLLRWFPAVDTEDLENNAVRTDTRHFVSCCLTVLAQPGFLDHPAAPEVERVMTDVADRAGDYLTAEQEAGLRRFRERADLHRARGILRRQGGRAVPGRGSPRVWRLRWRWAARRGPAEQAAVATAWTTWAVERGDPELLAEAYGNLVRHVPRDAAARSAGERRRVLAAAQEHTEEAGYWLAKARRYREAVVALETGRAIAGSGVDEVTYPDVTAVTGDGALVYLAAARAGGYALVVASDHDPQFIELPGLSRPVVTRLLGRLTPAPGQAARSALRDLAPVAPERGPLAGVLTELWERGLSRLAVFGARGRVVTYLPIGLIGLLPLHAAGRMSGEHFAYTGTYSAVRYAPNARALRRSRAVARSLPGPGALLAVDVPDGFGATGRLLHVGRETAAARRLWPAAASVRSRCTWPEFRDAAAAHTVWHLACHGAAEPRSILDSRLVFADRQVTLGELRAALPRGPRRLAVLSACETNLADPELPNEVVGMPSALLEAGFAGVIASSWKVDDLATAHLMTRFYREWCAGGLEPAVALNQAQEWLRTATRTDLADAPPPGDDPAPYADPRFWAAFAYTGA